ncbi:hypothetical protein N8448_04395 [Gammaproteobacteria bacterium]|nr:hypothetical protein [Gammaproteobacteria bacterium]
MNAYKILVNKGLLNQSIFIIFLSGFLYSDDIDELDTICSISKIPIVNAVFDCRPLTNTEIYSLDKYWDQESNGDLCHYFYFPIADPRASERPLLENYLLMEEKIKKRGLNCFDEYRNIFWYRGKGTMSMLQKLREQYPILKDYKSHYNFNN